MWAGGKTRLLKHYRSLMPSGPVGEYSEPFFGGGALFIEVMAQYKPRRVFINDINPGIMGIYRNIRDHLGEFTGVLDRLTAGFLPLSYEDRRKFYYDLRHEHAWNYSGWSQVEESATLYFLMKTGFNGIWQVNLNTGGRFGTPCGLLRQQDQVYDRSTVKEWHDMLRSTDAQISSEDWKTVPTGDWTFYDPPYRDSFADYGNSFPDSEVEEIIKRVGSTQGKRAWLSNRDSGDGFFDGRSGTTVYRFPVTYTAGRRKRIADPAASTGKRYEAKKAVEILMVNTDSIPGLLDPA